jgi:hypothetical protein
MKAFALQHAPKAVTRWLRSPQPYDRVPDAQKIIERPIAHLPSVIGDKSLFGDMNVLRQAFLHCGHPAALDVTVGVVHVSIGSHHPPFFHYVVPDFSTGLPCIAS